MTLAAGTRLGPYEILAPIGENFCNGGTGDAGESRLLEACHLERY